ncbi:DDB1- and CUL4-associated factor 15 [Portunus trituberculatus]|uniref:DDB1-and CUL4-associated factor 15 n=1 Tax=Portunus trituberculatus TaxID=210409 RepID=A0A5B7DZH5_PORTR|nr:DDB1- and CUL4-associated factor 15 [Portunus trituberculatus]
MSSSRVPGLRQHGRHHLMQKLHFRELYGETRQTRSRPRQKLFYQLPHRLAFSLAEVAPASALAAGHVFLGFTKCGQFVLSYTHSSDTDDHTLQMEHSVDHDTYIITLFTLTIFPVRFDRLPHSMIEGSDGTSSQTRRCCVTITAVPSLDNCSACYQVATSYEEEDLAERWNSCARFSCLKHGITVHTSFEMVPPFPKFLPSVQMKRRGFVVLNAGNFIHVLHVDIENVDRRIKDSEVEGTRLSCIRVREEDESDDDRDQHKVKHRRVSGEQQYSVPTLRSHKYSATDSSTTSDPEVDSQSSCEEEERDQCISITPVTKNTGLKITLNMGSSSLCSTSTTDRDREWEILIGSVPARGEGRTKSEGSGGAGGVSAASGSGCQRSASEGQGTSHACEAIVCDNNKGHPEGDGPRAGLASNLTLKDFHFLEASPRHYYGESDYCNDNDSDDSTWCSHASEDLRRNDLRDTATSGAERHRPPVGHCGVGTKGDDCVFGSQLPQQQPQQQHQQQPQQQHQQQQGRSRMVLRSSSESSCGEKTPTKQAEKEYEFIDEITDSRHEKLSVFRRRRLADKKYEFSDENMENIPQNYSSYRNQSRRLLMSPSRSPRFRSMGVPLSELSIELGESSGLLRSVYEKLLSPVSSGGSPNDVLRPINQNITSPILSPRDDRWREEREMLEKAELQRWSSRESLGVFALSPGRVQKSSEKSTAGLTQNNASEHTQSLSMSCVVDFNRRYIEVDDELVSIITDIEDDELSTATGYHNALPLEVHGSGYTQMQMISNTKAEKLNAPGVLVKQISLDVEQFCHELAQRVCTEANKKYFFCNDYNVEIVEVCPDSGDIVALASVLVQAATLVKGLPKTARSPLSSLTRRQYKTTATFVFNMDTKQYYVVEKEPLTETDPYCVETMDCDVGDERWWLGARQAARQLRAQWSCPTDYYSSVKVMTNEPFLKGKSLNHIMESQHLVALVLGPQPQDF